MFKTYSIIYNGNTVGNAIVRREGLYYAFDCQAQMPKGNIYRLKLSDGDKCIELGICVPERNCFVVRKKIPVKYWSGERFNFQITCTQNGEEFYPVREDRPFAYLKDLHRMKFSVRAEAAGVILEDPY